MKDRQKCLDLASSAGLYNNAFMFSLNVFEVRFVIEGNLGIAVKITVLLVN